MHYYTFIMSKYEKKVLELEFEKFTRMNFEKPTKCKSLVQIRYYIKELTEKIDELKQACNYVPNKAYTLLNQYNNRQNSMIFTNFQEAYC